MTNHEAQSVGRIKTIKATAVCLAIPLLILLLLETNGDFANGILFFIDRLFTIHNFIILVIIFSCTFLFGGKAGKDIIIGKKNFLITSVKYVSLIYLAVFIYIVIADTILIPERADQGILHRLEHYLLPTALTSLKTMIPLLAAWLWATYRMTLKQDKTTYQNMWTHKTTFAIGGLHEVGYAPKQDHLIVLSSQGQGIFDCIKGEKIARLHNDLDWSDEFNEETNSIIGFDILADIEIPTSGLDSSDNMPKKTADGWKLIITDPEPDEKPYEKYLFQKIYLISPDKKEKILIGDTRGCEHRAFGFSETGNSLIIASSCDLVIYSRTQLL